MAFLKEITDKLKVKVLISAEISTLVFPHCIYKYTVMYFQILVFLINSLFTELPLFLYI